MDDDERKRFEDRVNGYLAEKISESAGYSVDHPEDFYQLSERRAEILSRRCWVCRTQAVLLAHGVRVMRWSFEYALRHRNRPYRSALVMITMAAWMLLLRLVSFVVKRTPCVKGCRTQPPEKGEDERED